MLMTTVMYHYVRPIKQSEFPNIKGLEISGFRRQLDYLSARYTFVSAEHLIAAVTNGEALPNNACLLTFDDGYRDHFDYVLPELKKRNIKGCFFPPACSVVENRLLDVNAIHFILAACQNVPALIEDLKEKSSEHGLGDSEWDALWKTTAKPNRFDTKEVIFFKRMLQRELNEGVRRVITHELFEKYVGRSEEDFCSELYMTAQDLRELLTEGMYVGNHTYNHVWLNAMTRKEQELEIDSSMMFLADIGAPKSNWIMCYPYGGYNDDTIEILKSKGCVAGLTTKVGVADLAVDSPFEITRFDTNDFPQ